MTGKITSNTLALARTYQRRAERLRLGVRRGLSRAAAAVDIVELMAIDVRRELWGSN